MAKEKKRDIKIIDRKAPRLAIQITENRGRRKTKMRRRQSVVHLTVTNSPAEEARRIIIKGIEKAGGR